MSKARARGPVITLEDDPLWYKDAVIYEARVRAFYDSNGDGIGDFPGLTQKLDYLQELGITALWLLPFYPSPLRDDGYDIADYFEVHPDCGTLNDFKVFLREAHKRGLRVITELVINHTSDQHPWFQRARNAKRGSRYRDFYVWSDDPAKYRDARIIFKDFEPSNWTWDPVAKAYCWHRFFSHQPDLNFDNPAVRRAVLQALDFWLNMGVDGLRLDAIPYLYEREGTNCENLPETHAFLRELRAHVDRKHSNRMLLAEANQWPEDAVEYLGDGDECHMAFHFPIMPRMFMAIQMEDRYPIIDILNDTPAIPETAQWALFLRNHDELTLEMVTDEERDYMYRMYAHEPHARINLGIRRRLAPLLANNRRKIELMNGLLFSLPGTPVLYYGDEIGMGDNIYLGDRNGVRTPMQWSADRNAGFSRANPQLLYLPVIIDPEYHFETINVETQQNNSNSLYWWMRRLIALRKRHKAFGRGSIEFLTPSNPKVLAFLRHHEGEHLLVVANLSRFPQYVELDLQAYDGAEPVEMFGHTRFPRIGALPYLLTLGPHTFLWFNLTREEGTTALPAEMASLPGLRVEGAWTRLLEGRARGRLEELLPAYLRSQRWFGGKARTIRSLHIAETIPVPLETGEAVLTLLQVDYADGSPETYLLPLGFATGDQAAWLRHDHPRALLAEVRAGPRGSQEDGVLYDAVVEPSFGQAMLGGIRRRRQFRGTEGTLYGHTTRGLRSLGITRDERLDARVLSAEQSNTAILFGDRLIMKLFRRLEEGENPDLEIGRHLTEQRRFANSPAVAGYLEYRFGRSGVRSLGILHGFVPNHGEAWRFTLDELGRYFERVSTRSGEPPDGHAGESLIELAQREPDAQTWELIGPYLDSVRLLGQRTAEMHLALAGDAGNDAFTPEAFSQLYQRSLYQAFRSQVTAALGTLRGQIRKLPENLRGEATRLLEHENDLVRRFHAVVGRKMNAKRVRTHGDYHLGQVLYTGKDFIIIDYEGEPARPISERRIKRPALRDVAGMVRSFDYAASTGLRQWVEHNEPDATHAEAVVPWARCWYRSVAGEFLRAYLETTAHADFMPTSKADVAVLLDVYLLEKALYELTYELNSRPDWLAVPLRGLLQLLDTPAPSRA